MDTNPGKEAMKTVREAGKTADFLNDPVATLKSLGVDTTNLRIHKTSAAEGATHSTCVSGGCGVCVSTG